MKNFISGLNKNFDNRIRLGIMSVLAVNEWVEFNVLKDMLELTDGNLASHISSLEKNGYLETRKQFIARKPNTSYRITQFGKLEFKKHIDSLEIIIKEQNFNKSDESE
ncbi:MAG: transcriptional regulator [Bacteroidales bacterium]